ncbi:MAG TPA: hypothetical protein VFM63_02975 [Pyrinomonadaceae bacterium]|nr:hypothetical protein [Pyrinomonadaceae bacterium]
MTNSSGMHDRAAPSLGRCVTTGAIGFGVVSLIVFATVAFGERWMYQHLSVTGAYLVWTVLFILLGGGALGSLVVGAWRLPKFYLLFGLAFFAYAMNWMAAYFIVGGTVGEWVGSLAGSVLMALVFAAGFETIRSTGKFALILFIANSLGYFLGSALNNAVRGPSGMLLWGVAYGLFLGAGIGAVLHYAQVRRSS